jgi:2-polyprenyl-6-methoxyphenol hydroxylase-like FAD-dependent oxidoreductase
MSTVEKGADVLVVGAGPTGLAMGIELARQGVRCRVIDKAPEPSKTSKALAVQARTLEYFDRIGIADAAVAAGLKVHGLNAFSDRKRIVHVTADGIPSRYNYILILPQSETERLLTERLAARGVAVERNLELSGFTQAAAGVEAVLRRAGGGEERLRVRWLVGCDGPHSTVRHQLNVPFPGLAFEEVFSLADVQLESSLPDDEASIFLSHGDILAFFPMRGEQRFRVVIERHEGAVDPASEPTLEEFRKAIDDYGPKGARVSDPVWMSRFRINQRQAADYRRGHVFLAGDASHIHSPVGGQGMNTGIQDAANLGWKLALAASGRGRPELLDSYQAERHPVGETLLRATGGFSRVVLWRNPAAEAVRNRIASILTRFDVVQDRIRMAASELGIHYRRSPIVRDDAAAGLGGAFSGWMHRGPHAGDRAPDGTALRAADRTPVRLFELLAGARHMLMVFGARRLGEDDARRRAEAVQAAQAHAGLIDSYLVLPEVAALEAKPAGATLLLDSEGALHRAYGAEDELLCLIRPDGYIGYRNRPADAAKLRDYLGRIFT